MKRLVLLCLLISLFSTAAFSQRQTDSIYVSIDTINIRGFVYDIHDVPLAGVKVYADLVRTKTSKTGYFELKGVRNKSHIFFQSDTLADILFGNSSRFIVYHLLKREFKLIPYDSKLQIEAKREKLKPHIERKVPNTVEFPHYENEAMYPGGMQMFYKFIKDNLIYPEQAIKSNIEGIVGIEFDVTRSGTLDNFKIVKDIGFDTSKALINVLKKAKKWNPALSGSAAVLTKFYLEIPFKLLD